MRWVRAGRRRERRFGRSACKNCSWSDLLRGRTCEHRRIAGNDVAAANAGFDPGGGTVCGGEERVGEDAHANRVRAGRWPRSPGVSQEEITGRISDQDREHGEQDIATAGGRSCVAHRNLGECADQEQGQERRSCDRSGDSRHPRPSTSFAAESNSNHNLFNSNCVTQCCK